jgi:hypothetical protein
MLRSLATGRVAVGHALMVVKNAIEFAAVIRKRGD